MIQVILICRKPFKGQFSIEGYFDRVVSALSNLTVSAKKVVVPFYSKGLIQRLGIIFFSYFNQKTVTHITGDIQFAAILTAPERTVLTVLDCQVLVRSSGIRKKLLKYFWFILPTRRVAAITVISAETRRQLLYHVPSINPKKIHIVPVSVSELFKPVPKSFISDCPRILQIGTKSNKNVSRLVAALKGLSCLLVIVGQLDDKLKQSLKENTINYENLINLSDEELVEQYQRCDILAFVSTYEGFGMPIVEAQVVERVVVTSNCSSMPEVAGDGACLVDPYNVESIRIGIERVITDPEYRNSLIEAGRDNCKRFDNAVITRQYLEIYQAIAAGI